MRIHPVIASLLFMLLVVSPVFAQDATATAPTIDTTEYAALRVIRNSLDDQPGSTFFSTWDFTLDPCVAFRGVVCSLVNDEQSQSQLHHVVMLSLGSGFAGSPGLTGRLSGALGSLRFLRVLTLVPGGVHGPIPPQIGSLTRLEFLGLSKNLLSGSIPSSIAALQRLEGLDLSGNKLEGEIPGEIASLPSLSTLILSSNDLSGFPNRISSPLSRLSLDRNQLSGSISAVALPQTLVHLDLSRNSLEGSIPPSMMLLDRLQFLDLSFNRLAGGIPGVLFNLPSLGELLLQRNSLSGEVSPEGPVRISKVDLSHNAISGSPSPLLATVRDLLLNNNKLSGNVPGEIVAGMAAGDLQNLYLQHNFLSAIEGGDIAAALLPGSCVFCIQYNCMPPPAASSCPSNTGKEFVRPSFQCQNVQGDWD